MDTDWVKKMEKRLTPFVGKKMFFNLLYFGWVFLILMIIAYDVIM